MSLVRAARCRDRLLVSVLGHIDSEFVWEVSDAQGLARRALEGDVSVLEDIAECERYWSERWGRS